jgi:ParB family chromosome partitioning protein
VALARAVGFVDPVTVRPLPGTIPPHYEILTGLQHWLLAQRAQLATVPVLVRERLSDDDAGQLVAQDTGQDCPHPIVEARAIRSEVDRGRSVAAAGRALGLSRTEASHRLRLLRLAPSVQMRVATGELETGKARALVGLPERAQLDLARRIAREGLTTRQVEALAKAGKQGGGPPRTATGMVPAPPAKDPNLVRLETDLANQLGTRVTVTFSADGQGQLIVDFANLEILDGVLERLGYKP